MSPYRIPITSDKVYYVNFDMWIFNMVLKRIVDALPYENQNRDLINLYE